MAEESKPSKKRRRHGKKNKPAAPTESSEPEVEYSFEDELVIKETVKLKDEESISQSEEGIPVDLYFLYSDKNYIVLQGINYCASFRYYPNDDDKKVIYKDPIVNQYGSASVDWD